MSMLHKKQKGLTLTGWIFVVAVALFFVLLGLSLVPSYLRFYSITSIMDSMVEEPSYKGLPKKKLRDAFMKRININSVYDFDKSMLIITRIKTGGYEMTVEYQELKPMAGNIEALLSFKNTVNL